jgi:hypothetical protein
VGVLFDHRSSNLSEEVGQYLEGHGIERVPAGPYNAKGNGTDEGAFSQMKRALGVIRLHRSSPRELARSVLEKLLSLYISMRNRIPVRGRTLSPSEGMATPVPREQRDLERQKLKEHNRLKSGGKGDQDKLDRLHAMLRYHGMTPEPDALKHAQSSIKGYEKEAISAAEEAFLKAVKRNPEKKSLSYFFAILVRIQREREDEAYKRYCTQRYNEEVMMQLKQQEQESPKTHSVEGVLSMLVQAVKASVQFVRETALRKAQEWTQELMEAYRYVGVLKTSFSEALGKVKDLTVEEKNRIWELIEQFLNPKTAGESVTQIS